MKGLRRVKALIKKEGYQIKRDLSTMLISIVLPLFLLFIYGFGVSLDMDHLRMGVVLEDNTPETNALLESFSNSSYFDVTLARDRREMVEKITKGSIRGFVVIPSYFSSWLKNPNKIAPLQVIADGSEPNTANFVLGYSNGAIQNWIAQKVQNQPAGVEVHPRFWYNEQLESRFFLLSGSLAIIMTLIGTLLTALVVAREWERGTMEALMSTPVTVREIMLGKLIPYFILGMVSMTICVIVSVFGYGLPLRGSVFLLFFVSAVFLFAALGLGLMVSTFARVQVVAYQIAIVVGFLPAYILSGFLFEIPSMPIWIQYLTYLMPAKYFVQALQTLFLVGNVWSLILYDVIPMLLMGFIFFAIISYKTVKRID